MSLYLETDLTSALKSSTKIPHASLEKNLLGHLRNISCNADYIKVLRLMYGYYHPLENKIEAVLGREESMDFKGSGHFGERIPQHLFVHGTSCYFR